MSKTERSDTDSGEMLFTDHLAELRGRIGKSLLAVVLASIACFFFSQQLFELLTYPLEQANAELQSKSGDSVHKLKLIGTGPAEAFIVKLKVSLAAGVVLVSPFLFLQLWGFIAPGLHQHERKLALPFVIASTVFFLIGVSFCFKGVLPYAFSFFVDEYASIHVAPDIKIGEYLSFTVRILLVFGAVFELPILSYFLSRVGILTSKWLVEKGRYGIVAIFIAAAMLTPPDVVTQCLLAGPLIILYGLCIIVAKFAAPEKDKKTAASEA